MLLQFLNLDSHFLSMRLDFFVNYELPLDSFSLNLHCERTGRERSCYDPSLLKNGFMNLKVLVWCLRKGKRLEWLTLISFKTQKLYDPWLIYKLLVVRLRSYLTMHLHHSPPPIDFTPSLLAGLTAYWNVELFLKFILGFKRFYFFSLVPLMLSGSCIQHGVDGCPCIPSSDITIAEWWVCFIGIQVLYQTRR